MHPGGFAPVQCLGQTVLPAGGVVLLVVNEVIQTVFVAHEGSLSTLDVSTQKEGRNNVGGTRNAQMFGQTIERRSLAQPASR